MIRESIQESIENNLDIKPVSGKFIKRAFDIVLSMLILPFILPLIAIISFLIKLDSSGDSVFVQERLGENFSRFNFYKFRTMYTNSDYVFQEYLNNNPEAAEEWNKYKKLRSYDPRITKVGNFLRKTSLDELPQIFNIIKGDMSFIGPRPYLPKEEKDMMPYVSDILSVKPGLTGLWQVSGRNKLKFEERVKLDSFYASNNSFYLDMVILFKTIKVVLLREGAF